MLTPSLRFESGVGEGRFYCHPKARWNAHTKNYRNSGPHGNGAGPRRSGPESNNSSFYGATKTRDRRRTARYGNEEEDEVCKPATTAAAAKTTDGGGAVSNLERFLLSTTPTVPAQYLSKTTLNGFRTCNVDYQPYYVLEDLWEAFKEWSVYGAGVPLVLDGRERVVQYYVPYLSGIQLYGRGEARRRPRSSGGTTEESDSDCSRDSSSDASSDCELDGWSDSSACGTNGICLGQRNGSFSEGFSSDDSESGKDQLLFEYLERDVPYTRVPLTDKISELACRFPELRTLRSCDLLPTSWISVSWYPIYRIPTGPTLRDLDACFLTFHSLSMPFGGSCNSPCPIVTYPNGADQDPVISFPVSGLASYKLKGSVWTLNGGCKQQHSLQQDADKLLRQLRVDHPDYLFFVSRGAFCR